METYFEYLAKKDFDRDRKVFEKLSPKVRDLMILKEQAEKSIGEESCDLQDVILEKSLEPFPLAQYVIAHCNG